MRFARAHLLRKRRKARRGEALDDNRILSERLQCGVPFVEDGLRRPLGRVGRVPCGRVEVGQPHLRVRRHLEPLQPLRRCQRIGFHRPRLDLRHRRDRLVAEKIDLPCNEIVHRRARPTVRHHRQPHTGHVLQDGGTNEGVGADAGVSDRGVGALRLQPREQLRHGGRFEALAAQHDGRAEIDEADRLEVGLRIELEPREERRRRRVPLMLRQDRVAVRRRARPPHSADHAAGAGHVLDDQLRVPLPPDLLRHLPGERIGRSAGSEHRQQRDRLRGIRVLGMDGTDTSQRDDEGAHEAPDAYCHGLSPPDVGPFVFVRRCAGPGARVWVVPAT